MRSLLARLAAAAFAAAIALPAHAAWTLPDKGEGQNDVQSILFQEYLDVLVEGINGINAVHSGCTPTAQGSPDMTVAISACVVTSNQVKKYVSAGNATITTAHATNPRIDLVVISSSGSIAVRAGTAAAAPKPPARTSNDVVLAQVYVPANDTTISNDQITDLRVLRKASDWDVEIIKSADQDVTNNATVQNDTELKFAVASGEIWRVEIMLLYSGNNATGDYKFDFGLPTVTGWFRYLVDSTTADAINVSTGIRQAAVTALAAQVSLGTDASNTPRVGIIEFMFRAGSSADFQFKFANASAASGRISRTHQGSVLRARRLA